MFETHGQVEQPVAERELASHVDVESELVKLDAAAVARARTEPEVEPGAKAKSRVVDTPACTSAAPAPGVDRDLTCSRLNLGFSTFSPKFGAMRIPRICSGRRPEKAKSCI